MSQNAETLEPYEEWLQKQFADEKLAPLSERHHRLWQWFLKLQCRDLLPAQVEVWPRGGAKSSTVELGCAFLATREHKRNFVLYVSATQDQADLHVQSIAGLLEVLNVERGVGKYGNSKGWRRNQLRTNNDFNVAAYGLDVASRGIKLGRYRPDLIIFDDVDSEADTSEAVAKKIRAITSKILPTGSPDCAVLFIQNLIHENSIVSQLVDGRAEFLLDRVVPLPEPAVRGLKTEEYLADDGSTRIRITEGEPTWVGQDLATCQDQINKWGWPAFKREAQHEVKGQSGYFFRSDRLEVVSDCPAFVKVARAWDLAATEGGGDYTAGVLIGLASNGVLFVLDVMRGQWETSRVRRIIREVAELDNETWGSVSVVLPQDPGQAGKDQAESFKTMLWGFEVVIRSVTGRKETRAKNWQERLNGGNARVFLSSAYLEFKDIRSIFAKWLLPFREEHRLFRADEKHEFDDQVDAASDAANELLSETPYDRAVRQVLGMTRSE